MMNTTERARDALSAIPPNLGRDDWHRAGRAAIAAGIDVDELVEWSSNASNFKGEKDVRAAFRNISPDGGTSEKTLFKMAIEHGWVDPEKQQPQRVSVTPVTPKTNKPAVTAESAKPRTGMGAFEIWNRCEAATISHPYIAKKNAVGVPLDKLRVVPDGDSLTIQGERMAGALVVPVIGPDGMVSSLQFITSPETAKRLQAKGKPDKLNLPGHTVQGWFTVGDMSTGGTVYVVEGIGQAWACWQATGASAVVCFGSGNMGKVAQTLRQQDSTSSLVIVPDVGKEAEALKIAASVSGKVAAMPEGWARNSDVNDLAQRDGLDVLEKVLQSATEPHKPQPLLKPVSVGDVHSNPSPAPQFVWDGYLPRGVVSLFGAHGGTGKSTIALMLGVCTALGKPLFGVATVACNTVFVSLEDSEQVVRHRLSGICREWGVDPKTLEGRLFIVDGTQQPELFAADTRASGSTTATYEELKKLVQSEGIGLVLVDNASDAYGGDEIQRKQVRAFMRSLGQLMHPVNPAVMLLAHVDKNTSRNGKAAGGEGYSGSTAWHNSARSRLFLTRAEDGTLTLEHQKANLSKTREPITLEWLDGGFPQLVQAGGDVSDFTARLQGRADDNKAIEILKMIAEFESRQQFCSSATTSRNHVFAVLKSEPAFQKLKLNAEGTKRIVTQCQRANWIDVLEYRDHNRKPHQRWTLTTDGRLFAGIPAPTAPTAPTTEDGAHGAHGAKAGAPTAPTCVGGMGDRARTEDGAASEATVEVFPLVQVPKSPMEVLAKCA